MKPEIKFIAIYQLAGGLLGLFSTLFSATLGVLLFNPIASLILFFFSAYCGLILLMDKIDFGLKLSI